jgi:branched-chain amino acid transport system substrate-binding protein
MPKNRPVDTRGKSRRKFLQTGVGVAGGLLASGLLPAAAKAATHAPLGNWPKGASGKSVFVGITCPLTGPYSAAGEDLKKGYELAIEQINSGELARHWRHLRGKGVLGKQIRHQVGDTESAPNPGVQAQSGFIAQDKAIMITGSVNSATAIAIEKLAQREKVVYMTGASGSNDTTGKDCQRYGFRSQLSAYMAAKALAPVLGKQLGHGKKVAYLVPDYTYGASVFESMSEFTSKDNGWTIATKQLVPLGTKDFSSYLLNIANSGADIFINVAFGADCVLSTKQAKQFGILEKMKLVVPNISPFQAKQLGPELMQGVYGTFDFYWGLEDRFPMAKHFVETFQKRYQYIPEWCAHVGYLQTMIWAAAVEKAKSFYPVDVIKTLERGKWTDTTLGTVHYDAETHQLVRPVPVVVGKKPSEMKNEYDYYNVVGLVPGAETMPPASITGCKLGSYT